MKIEWTRCADKMPPDNCTPVIFRSETSFRKATILYGHQLHWCNEETPLHETSEWTPYTPEKWKELNK